MSGIPLEGVVRYKQEVFTVLRQRLEFNQGDQGDGQECFSGFTSKQIESLSLSEILKPPLHVRQFDQPSAIRLIQNFTQLQKGGAI